MSYRRSIALAAIFLIGGIASAAAELPSYEVTGFPITPHQLVAMGPAHAEQELPAVTSTMAGMPASPHQIAVLTPRQTESPSRQEHAQVFQVVMIGRVQ